MFSVVLIPLRALVNCLAVHDAVAELETSAFSVPFRAQLLAGSEGECLSSVAAASSLLFNSLGLRFTSCVTDILFVA